MGILSKGKKKNLDR